MIFLRQLIFKRFQNGQEYQDKKTIYLQIPQTLPAEPVGKIENRAVRFIGTERETFNQQDKIDDSEDNSMKQNGIEDIGCCTDPSGK